MLWHLTKARVGVILKASLHQNLPVKEIYSSTDENMLLFSSNVRKTEPNSKTWLRDSKCPMSGMKPRNITKKTIAYYWDYAGPEKIPPDCAVLGTFKKIMNNTFRFATTRWTSTRFNKFVLISMTV